MKTKNEQLYEEDHGTVPPICLPKGLDRSNFVDITRIGDSWRRYLDTQTGKMHDGAVYADLARRIGPLQHVGDV